MIHLFVKTRNAEKLCRDFKTILQPSNCFNHTFTKINSISFSFLAERKQRDVSAFQILDFYTVILLVSLNVPLARKLYPCFLMVFCYSLSKIFYNPAALPANKTMFFLLNLLCISAISEKQKSETISTSDNIKVKNCITKQEFLRVRDVVQGVEHMLSMCETPKLHRPQQLQEKSWWLGQSMNPLGLQC